jgi:hypothetical protein
MRQHLAKIRMKLVMASTIAAIGLSACGGANGGDVRTVTIAPTETSAQETPTSAPVSGDAILIETRVTNAERHTGEVLGASVLGESAFCRGGNTSGGSEGPTITTTFRCNDGTLKVQYAPTQPSLVQGSVWEVVSGTGSFDGVRGGGSMVAKFESDSPDTGHEVFTGTVGR